MTVSASRAKCYAGASPLQRRVRHQFFGDARLRPGGKEYGHEVRAIVRSKPIWSDLLDARNQCIDDGSHSGALLLASPRRYSERCGGEDMRLGRTMGNLEGKATRRADVAQVRAESQLLHGGVERVPRCDLDEEPAAQI